MLRDRLECKSVAKASQMLLFYRLPIKEFNGTEVIPVHQDRRLELLPYRKQYT